MGESVNWVEDEITQLVRDIEAAIGGYGVIELYDIRCRLLEITDKIDLAENAP